MELDLVAAVGVVLNGLVAQLLAFLAAKSAVSAHAAAARATVAAQTP
jgi:hypothetical protein